MICDLFGCSSDLVLGGECRRRERGCGRARRAEGDHGSAARTVTGEDGEPAYKKEMLMGTSVNQRWSRR